MTILQVCKKLIAIAKKLQLISDPKLLELA